MNVGDRVLFAASQTLGTVTKVSLRKADGKPKSVTVRMDSGMTIRLKTPRGAPIQSITDIGYELVKP